MSLFLFYCDRIICVVIVDDGWLGGVVMFAEESG